MLNHGIQVCCRMGEEKSPFSCGRPILLPCPWTFGKVLEGLLNLGWLYTVWLWINYFWAILDSEKPQEEGFLSIPGGAFPRLSWLSQVNIKIPNDNLLNWWHLNYDGHWDRNVQNEELREISTSLSEVADSKLQWARTKGFPWDWESVPHPFRPFPGTLWTQLLQDWADPMCKEKSQPIL